MKLILLIKKEHDRYIKTLLIDMTTNRNIILGTDDYEYLGNQYNSHFPIKMELITGKHSNIIRPRILKAKEKQGTRTKDRAEVFTPSWICNAQNNLIDNAWFCGDSVFNIKNEMSLPLQYQLSDSCWPLDHRY